MQWIIVRKPADVLSDHRCAPSLGIGEGPPDRRDRSRVNGRRMLHDRKVHRYLTWDGPRTRSSSPQASDKQRIRRSTYVDLCTSSDDASDAPGGARGLQVGPRQVQRSTAIRRRARATRDRARPYGRRSVTSRGYPSEPRDRRAADDRTAGPIGSDVLSVPRKASRHGGAPVRRLRASRNFPVAGSLPAVGARTKWSTRRTRSVTTSAAGRYTDLVETTRSTAPHGPSF